MKHLLCFCLLGALALAACSSPACKVDGDCKSGEVCNGGNCIADTRPCGPNQPFAPEALTHAGSTPEGLAVGDFNSDGHPDLAVADYGGTVQILLNNGDGTMRVMQPPVVISGNPSNVAVGDFNGDGKADLAVSSSDKPDILVVFGNGDGTFQTTRHSSPGAARGSPLAVADLNGDGMLDLAAFDPTLSGVVAMFGANDGTFAAQMSIPVGSALRGLVAADFNGDSPDIAAVGTGVDGGLGVLLNQTNGMLGPAATYLVGDFPIAVTTSDFNGDGHLDLIVLDGEGTVQIPNGILSVLLGKGDGTFGAASGYPVANVPTSLGVGDFNGDGHQDAYGVALLTATSPNGRISLLLGNGDGTLSPFKDVTVATDPGASAVADFNGDGHPDIAVAHGAMQHTGQIGILLNTCK